VTEGTGKKEMKRKTTNESAESLVKSDLSNFMCTSSF